MTPRVLVARPDGSDGELSHLLRERSLEPVRVPTIAIDYAPCIDAVDRMLAGLAGAAWLVFGSAHGVEAVTRRMAPAKLPAPGPRVAAVGSRTASTLEDHGFRVAHVPRDFVSAAIADGLGRVTGCRIVIVAGDTAGESLPAALRDRGALVEEVVAYRIIEGPPASRDPLQAALHRGLDGLAFTSGSTVRGLLRLASPLDRARARSVPAFCIGPPTAATARRLGFDVAAVASVHTSTGLANTIGSYFIGRTS